MIPKAGRVIHTSDSYGVPVEWLGERFIRDRELLKQRDELAWRHEYKGEPVGTGTEVFTNVELRELSDGEVAALGNIRQGLDWGYANDPVAFVRCSFDRKRQTLTIFDERGGIGISNRALDSLIPTAWKSIETRPDSSEPKSIDEMKDEFGWKVRGATKGPGSVERGIKWLAGLKIIIDPVRCPHSAKEFVNYALDRDRSGQVISRYPDRDNHWIDATKYACEDDMLPEPEPIQIVRPVQQAGRW
jgi:phage terminase large subunit